jgi:CRP-like cAMP-binding protein
MLREERAMSPKDEAPALTELVEHLEAGEFVFRAGEKGESMYIIQEGEVEILLETGGQEQRLALLSEGDFFGEMAVLEELPRTASARTLTPCTLLRIDRATFDQLIRQDPEIAVRLLRKLSHRLRLAQTVAFEAPPAVEARAPERTRTPSSAYLLHRGSGTQFPLAWDQENTIGRRDPVTGLVPTVDLGAVDRQKTTSRRHATLFHKDQTWFLREEAGVRNGTFVNGQRLASGQAHPVAPGDLLRFGLVELEFHVG